MKKSIAIIGAGPAGIIAARKLLQCGDFEVTIFERSDRVGGSWVPEGIINPMMRTNQSKFTMSFSDLSWESLGSFPVYPKASDVYGYLEEYFKRYIPRETVRFGTTVESVEHPSEKAVDGSVRWKLHLQQVTADGTESTFDATFDFLVAAPGFYSVPKIPSLSCPSIPLLHSTAYRTLEDIDRYLSATDGERKILVVGGSHSGGDIAALIALQLCDAQHSPQSPDATRSKWKKTRVIHISSREMFALPAFIADSRVSSCSFQPIDFTLFNRSSRPANPPPIFTTSLVTPEKVKASRKMIHTIIDGDEGYTDTRKLMKLAPIGILGDHYSQFVKTGLITQVQGTLNDLQRLDEENVAASLINTIDDKVTTIENVCAVVCATGFEMAASLAFLSSQVKDALGFDAGCAPAPIILDGSFLSQNSNIPTLGLLGFPGAYWPLFEMQARTLVHAWSLSTAFGKSAEASKLDQRSRMRDYYEILRRAIREGRKEEVPHNAFGDSLGLLEEASRYLDLERFDLGSSETDGFVCSARYTEPGSDKTEAMKTLMAVQKVRRDGQRGGFLARAVARGLMGSWIGAVQTTGGPAIMQKSFRPRYPTDAAYDWEYLAVSVSGDAKLTLHEVYRYAEATDCLSVWSVQGDGFSAKAQTGKFDFRHPRQEHGKNTAVAVMVPGDCQAEELDGLRSFQFHFAGAELRSWTLSTVGKTDDHETSFVRISVVLD